MGYADDCFFAPARLEDAAQHSLLGLRIKGGARLVQHQDSPRTQQRPSHRNPLRLPLGKSATRLKARSIKSLRKVKDEFSCSIKERRAQFLVRGLRVCGEQILAYCSAHKAVALGHIHKVAAGSRR